MIAVFILSTHAAVNPTPWQWYRIGTNAADFQSCKTVSNAHVKSANWAFMGGLTHSYRPYLGINGCSTATYGFPLLWARKSDNTQEFYMVFDNIKYKHISHLKASFQDGIPATDNPGQPVVESSIRSLYAILESRNSGVETSKIVELSIPIDETKVRFLSYPHYRVPEKQSMLYLQKKTNEADSALFFINNYHGISSQLATTRSTAIYKLTLSTDSWQEATVFSAAEQSIGLNSLDYLQFGGQPYMVFGGCKVDNNIAGVQMSVPIMFAVDFYTLAVHDSFDVTISGVIQNACIDQVLAVNMYSNGKVMAVISPLDSNYAHVASDSIIVAHASPGSIGSVVPRCSSKVSLLYIQLNNSALRLFGWMGIFQDGANYGGKNLQVMFSEYSNQYTPESTYNNAGLGMKLFEIPHFASGNPSCNIGGNLTGNLNGKTLKEFDYSQDCYSNTDPSKGCEVSGASLGLQYRNRDFKHQYNSYAVTTYHIVSSANEVAAPNTQTYPFVALLSPASSTTSSVAELNSYWAEDALPGHTQVVNYAVQATATTLTNCPYSYQNTFSNSNAAMNKVTIPSCSSLSSSSSSSSSSSVAVVPTYVKCTPTQATTRESIRLLERPSSTYYLQLSTAYTEYATECLAAAHRFSFYDASCSKQLTATSVVLNSEQVTSYNELPVVFIRDTFQSVWDKNQTLQTYFDLNEVNQVNLCLKVEIAPTVVSASLTINQATYTRTVQIEVAESASTIAQLSEPAPTLVDFESKEIALDQNPVGNIMLPATSSKVYEVLSSKVGSLEGYAYFKVLTSVDEKVQALDYASMKLTEPIASRVFLVVTGFNEKLVGSHKVSLTLVQDTEKVFGVNKPTNTYEFTVVVKPTPVPEVIKVNETEAEQAAAGQADEQVIVQQAAVFKPPKQFINIQQVSSTADLAKLPKEELKKLDFPKIHKIKANRNGQIIFYFTEEMKLLDISRIKDFIMIEFDRHPENYGANPRIEGVEFVSIVGKKLTLRLNLPNALEISTQGRDRLKITVNDHTIFEMKRQLKTYSFPTLEPGQSSIVSLPRQMPQDKGSNNANDVGEAMSDTVLGANLGIFVINLLLSQAMGLLYMSVNVIQIIVHIPIMKLLVPANLSNFYGMLMPIANFDIMPEQFMYEWFAISSDQQIEEGEEESQLDNFLEIDYDTHNIIALLGSAFLILLFIAVGKPLLISIYYLASFCCYKESMRERISSQWEEIKKAWLIFFVEDSLTCMIGCYLNALNPNFETPGNILGAIVTPICGFMCIVYLPYHHIRYYACVSPEELLRQQAAEELSLQDLFENIDLRKKGAAYFYLIHLARRLFYVAIIALALTGSVSLQLAAFFFGNLFQAIYIYRVQPYMTRGENRLDGFNEWCILQFSTIIFLFTNFVHEAEMRYSIGWSLAGLLGFCLLVNLLNLVYAQYVANRRYCYRCLYRRCAKKEGAEVIEPETKTATIHTGIRRFLEQKVLQKSVKKLKSAQLDGTRMGEGINTIQEVTSESGSSSSSDQSMDIFHPSKGLNTLALMETIEEKPVFTKQKAYMPLEKVMKGLKVPGVADPVKIYGHVKKLKNKDKLMILKEARGFEIYCKLGHDQGEGYFNEQKKIYERFLDEDFQPTRYQRNFTKVKLDAHSYRKIMDYWEFKEQIRRDEAAEQWSKIASQMRPNRQNQSGNIFLNTLKR